MAAFDITPPDERALLRGLAEGSEEALAAIYDRTAPVLYPLALRIVGTRERACCVLEDLFEELWRDRALSSGATFAIPMATLIARCRDLALAQAAPEPRRPMTDPGPEAEGGATGSERDLAEAQRAPSEGVFTRDLGPFVSRQAALEALLSLPRADRLALEEAYFRGTGARDIAALVGTPTTDAAVMLRRALVRFREHVDQGGAPEGDAGAEVPEASGRSAGSRAES